MAKVTGGDLLVRLFGEVNELREEFKQNAKRVDGHLSRIGRLIGELAQRTQGRLEDLEERVDALEG